MADTVLSGRWVVYYEVENRQKRIVRDATVTPTVIDTVNGLYSALQGLFDELTQMDDGVPMSAQTPTEYTIGIIDAGDKDPWFIDRTSAEYLSGGAIKTASWTRGLPGDGTGAIGIVRMAYTETVALVPGDIGLDVLMTTDGDRGTLLDYNATGSTKYMWIRPDSNALANDFNNAPTANGAWTIVGGTGTGSQTGGAATTGESLWANIYNTGLANIELFTHQYVYQNGAYLTKYKSTTSDWWGDGQIDILINVKELSTERDEGYVTVLARQYSKTYDNFIVDLTAGGRNPIPLATGSDLNNTTGNRQFTSTSGVGTFNSGNFIYAPAAGGWSAATKRGVLTAVSGSPGTTPTLSYYLIGDLTDFVNTDTVKEYTGTADGDASCTSAAPSDIGPSTYSITATHANNSADFDIDESGTNENYSIVVDLTSTYSVAQGYEWSKYMTRRGSTSPTTATDGIEGERYIGSDYRLQYSGSITGTIAEGDTISQATSLATGTIVASHTGSIKIIILRNSRLTFTTTGLITGSQAGTFTPNTAATSLAPIKAAPFGTFAGGTWFGAPGVVFKNVLAADANKYQLTDDNGNVVKAPTKVTITVGNTRAGDRIAVYRLTGTGLVINKAKYNATVQSAEATTVVTGAAIAVDEPGKTAGGILRIVDVSIPTEYRLRYSSFTASTFTLASATLTAEAGTNTTNIKVTGGFTAALCKVGDLIYNVTRTATTYVTVRVDDDNVTVFPAVASQTDTDSIKKNVLPVATTTSPQDTIYVPLIDVYETTGTLGTPGSEEATITYSADVPVRVRARQAGVILPYEADSAVTSTGMSNNVIRTPDTIFV